MSMEPAEIAEERRRGRVAGVTAIAAGVLLAVGVVWSALANRDRPSGSDDDAERLEFFDDHAAELIGITGVRALGFLLLAFAIVHLQRATKTRNPKLSPAPLVVGLFGVVALAVGTIGQSVALADRAADFVTQSFPSERAADKAAEDVATESVPLVTGVIAFAGTFALALWFVLGALNGMRVGLLTRFLGVIGIIIGPGFVFGFALPLMVPWVVALGILFLGHWPRGMPPAWEAGEAVPWPGRESARPEPPEAEVSGGERDGEVEAVGPSVSQGGEQLSPEPGTRRKRKRRR